MLKNIKRDRDTWPLYALFAYSTALHSSFNEPSFFLLHGRDPDIPDDVLDDFKRTAYAAADNYRADLISLRLAGYEQTRKALHA